MCGIAGYAGTGQAEPFLREALSALEYRGYDSYGYLIVNDQGSWQHAHQIKSSIKDSLPGGFTGHLGIGHTRWATHGEVSLPNTHPILCGKFIRDVGFELPDCRGGIISTRLNYEVDTPQIAIVMNGIIENHDELRKQIWNYEYDSTTDTEVLGNLIDFLIRFRSDNIENILHDVYKHVEGNFACLFVHKKYPDYVFGLARGTPLYYTEGGYVASDTKVIGSYDRYTYQLNNGVLILSKNTSVTKYQEEKPIAMNYTIDTHSSITGTAMLSEIYEQPELIKQGIALPANIDWPNIDKVFLFGCGSSWHAAKLAQYYFQIGKSKLTEVEYATNIWDFTLKLQPPRTLFIGISQSGETADTISVMKSLKDCHTLSVSNYVNSTLVNLSKQHLNIQAGQETAVAATKTFTQTCLALFNLAMPDIDIKELVEPINSVLSDSYKIESIAALIKDYKHILYLGYGIGYPIALEGALKMKEVACVHAEAMPANEMKHGPIALIDDSVLSIFICNNMYGGKHSIVSNISQIKSRGGKILAICDTAGYPAVRKYADFFILVKPINPLLGAILANIPLQLLAYYVAIAKGLNVDRPRNLAKTVTV